MMKNLKLWQKTGLITLVALPLALGLGFTPKQNSGLKSKLPSISMSTADPSSDSTFESKYTECLEKHKNLILEQDYKEGNIIIGFDEVVTKEVADKFIESYDNNNELEMIKYFDETGIAIIKVPKGKEIDYVCFFDSIKDETIVDFTEPDYIISYKDSIS